MTTQTNATFRRIRVLNGYTAHARYLATVDDGGHIARRPEIASPYVSSPTHTVYVDDSGRNVIISEVSHARYEVFEVPATVAVNS